MKFNLSFCIGILFAVLLISANGQYYVDKDHWGNIILRPPPPGSSLEDISNYRQQLMKRKSDLTRARINGQLSASESIYQLREINAQINEATTLEQDARARYAQNSGNPQQGQGSQQGTSQQSQDTQQSIASQLEQQKVAKAKLLKENQAVDKMYKGADAAVAAAQEDAFMKMEANENWKKSSNGIWKNGAKDPWGDFQKKVDKWEATQSTNPGTRPMIDTNGNVMQKSELDRNSDEEWLRTIKSPHAKKP